MRYDGCISFVPASAGHCGIEVLLMDNDRGREDNAYKNPVLLLSGEPETMLTIITSIAAKYPNEEMGKMEDVPVDTNATNY